jgi:kynureninase
VDLALEAGMAEVEAKGRRLGDLFVRLVEDACGDLVLVSPRDADARGLHVSFTHPDGYAIVRALIARGVIGDFRAPDVLRFGFAPLYLRYADIWDAAATLADIMRSRAYDRPEHRVRAAVT